MAVTVGSLSVQSMNIILRNRKAQVCRWSAYRLEKALQEADTIFSA